jgi:hypothetical protein
VLVRKRALIGLTLVIGMGAVTVGNGGAASAHQVIAANRQAAVAEAGRLLTAVVLPAGGTAVAQESAGDNHQLATPFIGAFFAAEVDRHASNGLTGIRADAQVRYVRARLPSQRDPLSARLLQITKADVGARPLVSLVVTQRAIVRRLARVVNALPFVGIHAGVFSCPSFGGPIDTFVFRASLAGPPLATISESAHTPTDPSPCAPTTLTVRGHRMNSLLEGGILLRRAVHATWRRAHRVSRPCPARAGRPRSRPSVGFAAAGSRAAALARDPDRESSAWVSRFERAVKP